MVPNKPDDSGGGGLQVVMSCLVFLAGAATGGGCERRDWQREAVRNGAAEWKVDEDGYVEFFWKERAK